jgi:hypothetical protein
MPLKKYRSFFKNMFFGQKSRLSMQKFLCEMSENGYHLVKMTRTKCIFSEELSRRFLYSLCAEGDEQLYTQGDEWTHLLTFKNVHFYCKEIPRDAVSTERYFDKKKLRAEKLWLDARLAEGLTLMDVSDGRYIFRRDSSLSSHEYFIRRADTINRKSPDGVSPHARTKDMRFITVSGDGSSYYFINNTGRAASAPAKGERLGDQLLALFIATGSALAFCAALLVTAFGAIGAKVNGGSTLPWLIGGISGAVVFFVLFTVFFMRFRSIAEMRAILREEQRARKEALEREQAAAADTAPAAEQKQGDTTNNNSNIVMNTVVLNNYGDKKNVQGGAFPGFGEEFDPNLQGISKFFEANQVPGAPFAPPISAPAAEPLEAKTVPALSVGTYGENDIWQGEEIFGTASPAEPEPEPSAPPPEAPSAEPQIPITESSPRPKLSLFKRSKEKAETKPLSVPESVIDDDEWVSSEEEDGLEYDEEYGEEYGEEYDEGYYEDYDGEYDGEAHGVPIVRFIGNALLTFGGVVAFVLGLRYGIGWFASAGKNTLVLVLSAFAVAFSPFISYNSFNRCKELLRHHDYGEY